MRREELAVGRRGDNAISADDQYKAVYEHVWRGGNAGDGM